MKESLEEFYSELLGIEPPWEVNSIRRDSKIREVTAVISYKEKEPLACPVCQKSGRLYDLRERKWRHLDSCNHKTMIEARIPRVECSEHGVKQVAVTWAERNSRFTAEFEAVVLLWLKEDSISTVAANFGISWDEVDGIMARGVSRGLSRRKKSEVRHIGIDETSFQKRHEYITVILDKDRDAVVDILDDRKAETLQNWFKTQEIAGFGSIESITMDMWDPFIKAVRACFGNADTVIAFDRFHVAQHFGKAVDKVRAEESRSFGGSSNDNPLNRTKYQWLKNSSRTDNRTSKRKEFLNLTRMNLKTARAWRIKEAAALLWNYSYVGVAEKEWKKLLGWISRCKLNAVKAVGKMIKQYFWGIMNAIRLQVSNSMLEAKNARIQKIKNLACGFRNRNRFKLAILFHLGGLDCTPLPTR